jgi:hypothetical protein
MLAEIARDQREMIRGQAAAQSHTDERLNAFIDTVERYVSGRRNGQAAGETGQSE